MRVLVLCPNWIGDTVMATPALRSLRRKFPEARIEGVGRPAVGDVLAGLPFLDRFIGWDPHGKEERLRTGAVLRQLRAEEIDLAVVLPHSFRAAWLAYRARARRRVGYRRDVRGWLLSDGLKAVRGNGRFVPTPAVETYLRLVYHLGCPEETWRLDLATSEAGEAAAARVYASAELAGAERVVVLHPGAAYGSAKRWPTAHWAVLARNLVRSPSTRVLVLTGPADSQLGRDVVHSAGASGVADLGGEPASVELSKAAVRRAALLISTDSGPRHFAAAFGVPVVTLFGPTEKRWSETGYDRAVHLQKEVPCGPCQLKECPLDHRCMRELLPVEVLAAARTLVPGV